MKKLLTLILAAGMVVSAANGASAVEMKVSGNWLTSFSFADNLYGDHALVDDPENDGSFNAAQRIRINFDMVASESLSGRVQLQIANGEPAPAYYSWGDLSTGGRGKAVTARLAYLDWMIPSTDVLVRMGRQLFTVPSYTFGSPVFDSAIDGVAINAPINDMVGLTVAWLRPNAEVNRWGAEHVAHSSVDLGYLGLDVTADGFKVSPWVMAGLKGNASDGSDMMGYGASTDSRTTVYWVGLGGELTMFDPFKFTADFMYSGNDADGAAERQGWYAALGMEMKTSFATPFLRGWYASGDDADGEDSNRFMSINGGGVFDASSIYFDANGLLSATIDNCNPAGTWGVQLGVKQVSFIEDLTHALSVTYFQGTNNSNRVSRAVNAAAAANVTPAELFATAKEGGFLPSMGYMTTKDSAWSIDFLSSYKLYQNLTANLLLAYLITDFDENLWAGQKFDNGFRGTLNFTYAF